MAEIRDIDKAGAGARILLPMDNAQRTVRNMVRSATGDRRAAYSGFVSTMPNGDPPSVMLWGADDDRR